MTKIQELKRVVGEEVSENFSPTLRAKLIGFKKNQCVMEVVASPYVSMVQGGLLNNDEVGKLYVAPIYRIHNAFFF